MIEFILMFLEVHTLTFIKFSDQKFVNVNFSSIYIRPTKDVGPGSIPLIVWPHGGPHSISLNSQNRDAEFFVKLGFAVLLVVQRWLKLQMENKILRI